MLALFDDIYLIFINQEDIQERGRRVRLMRSIYKNAKEVFAWIVKDEPYVNERHPNAVQTKAKVVFEIMHRITDHRRVHMKLNMADLDNIKGRMNEEMRQMVEKAEARQKRIEQPLSYDPSWHLLEEFFSARWFWRRWVI